jgi:hypothetical protein
MRASMGSIYDGSPQLSDSASSIVLFPHAMHVEGSLTCRFQLTRGSDEFVWINQGVNVDTGSRLRPSGGYAAALVDETVDCHARGIDDEIAERAVRRIANLKENLEL